MRHEGVKVIQSLSHPPYVGDLFSFQHRVERFLHQELLPPAGCERLALLCRLHVYLYSVMELEDWNNDVHVNNHSLKLSLSLSHTLTHCGWGGDKMPCSL